MENIITVKNAYVNFLVPQGIFSAKDFFTSFKKPYTHVTILENINLEVNEGDSLAVFGKNGAGKSTLLRLLSGILKPDKGSVVCNGKIAPVMAIGAGLELEMSGFENIDLIMGLMGIKRAKEIKDRVIEFSELELNVLDQPLKTYSTGMVARLSFAISFVSDADIYVIDEVMAVGDLGFQKKCTHHIHSLIDKNKTIIFVSHNPQEMKSICEKGILLSEGKIIGTGNINEIATLYENLFA